MAGEFSIIHRVQFSETDMAGVVHFSNFFRMMEEAEHAYFRAVGLSVSMAHEGRAIGWPRVSVTCDFAGPLRFEDEVQLRFRPIKLGEKSLSYEVTFILRENGGSGRTVAVGKATSVCCAMADGGTFRAIPIPADIRRRLEAGPDLGEDA